MKKHFDIIVVGGGHAGLEAAYIAAQFDLQVAILTLPNVGLGSAPCNPSVGGVGKGQVVRELDAMGGLMGILADMAGIQYRTLNDSKGLAVQSTRVQIDKQRYSQAAEEIIASITNITVLRTKLTGLKELKLGYELTTSDGRYDCKKIILTVGTFLNGKMHTGDITTLGGRVGVEASDSLITIFSQIKTAPLRFKTGTPPRLLTATIDREQMEEQPSDGNTRNFHCRHTPFKRFAPQVSCYLTRTTEETMEVIRANKERSPMFNGQIKGTGARYCPSIEDKAYRYPDRHVHHVFVEPEGLELDTVYPSGISSSLPKDVQEDYIRTIPGLHNAKISVYGYAVEYDVVDTTELTLALEHVSFTGLYFAGQVNGTSGYEEAAGQGLVAGMNAALAVLGKDPIYLSRHDSYIGVMIEDLTSNTRDEPYRLFTSRAENRLGIREDNAILRMAPYRHMLGLNSSLDLYHHEFIKQYQMLSRSCDLLTISENSEILERFSGPSPEQRLTRRMTVSELLKQAWLNPIDTLEYVLKSQEISILSDVVRVVAIEKKYAGYIKLHQEQFERIKMMDSTKIDWKSICNSKNVSFECRSRIEKIKPQTFGQLKLIEGIRAATLAVVAGKAL